MNSIESTVQASRLSQSLNSRKHKPEYIARFECITSPNSEKIFDQKAVKEIASALHKECSVSSSTIKTSEDDRSIDISVVFSKPLKDVFWVEDVLIDTINSLGIEISEFNIYP